MSLIPLGFWKQKNIPIVTDQLICHLDAGITSSYPGSGSTWTDLTGNSNATLVNSPSFNSGNGGHLQFRVIGTSYADLNLVGVSSSTTVLTVEMWVRPIDMGATSGMPFGFTVYDLYQTSNGIGFNTAAGDQRGCYLSRLRNEDWWYDKWHHIVCIMYQTSSYTNNKIYINGRLYDSPEQISGSEDTGNRSFSTGQMRIGGWRTNTNYPCNEDVAVFRVYNKALTDTEVEQNFNQGRSRFSKLPIRNFIQDGCKMYSDFEGEFDWYTNSGSYVRDYSRVMQYGSLSGGIGWSSTAGGIMQFVSASSRFVNINRDANWFGLYYGSASFVYVFRYSTSGSLQYILNPTNARAYQDDVNIRVNSNNLYYSHNAGTEPSTTVAANTWYHVVMTYNYSTYVVQIYVNGTLVVSNGFQERMIALNDGYWLGRDTGSYYTFDLGLFMIYNRVITSTEVTTLFNTQKTRFGL